MFKVTLCAARISCGYTVNQVASYCSISRTDYESFEAEPGNIPKITAVRIKKLLGISLDSLCLETDY